MSHAQQQMYKAALHWYLDSGVDIALLDEPLDKTKLKPPSPVLTNNNKPPLQEKKYSRPAPQQSNATSSLVLLGASEARQEAVKLALAAKTLEELRDAIAAFDGLPIKKTATNLVFSSGNKKADVMIIGDAPAADDDRIGAAFSGEAGQLLDKILACIDLDRAQDDPRKACYAANIINWRPPGNRTPSPGEIEVSLPFIERQIQLVAPKVLIFAGAVSAKALLGRGEGISRLRKSWNEYLPQTSEYKGEAKIIPALATYHPAYLLKTPAQKRAVWDDMLMVQEKLKSL